MESLLHNNHTILSHTSDLDGRLSRELCVYLKGLPTDTNTVWVEYGKLIAKAQNSIEEWATGKDIIILDFSITQEFLNQVAKVANSVEVFDHHTGTLALIPPKNTTIWCDTAESTVSLLWKHHRGNISIPLIEVAREIDLNMIENPYVLGEKLYLDNIFFDESLDLQAELINLLQKHVIYNAFYNAKAKEQLALAKSIASRAIANKKDFTISIHRTEEDRGIDTDILAYYMLRGRSDFFAIISFDLPNDKIKVSSVRKLKSCQRDLVLYCKERGGGGRETAGSFTERLEELQDVN